MQSISITHAASAATPVQVVYDPFFHDMPRFFGCTFKELLAAKHPTAWVQVGCAGTERGLPEWQIAAQRHARPWGRR